MAYQINQHNETILSLRWYYLINRDCVQYGVDKRFLNISFELWQCRWSGFKCLYVRLNKRLKRLVGHVHRALAFLPAEVKKHHFDENTIEKLLEMQWWNGNEDELKKVKEFEFNINGYISS